MIYAFVGSSLFRSRENSSLGNLLQKWHLIKRYVIVKIILLFFTYSSFVPQGTSQRTTLLCFHYNSGYLVFLADLPGCNLCNLQPLCWRWYCFSFSFQYTIVATQAGQIMYWAYWPNPSLTRTVSR